MNKNHLKGKLLKLGVGVVVAGTLSWVGVVVRDTRLKGPSRAQERAIPTSVARPVAGGGADFLKDVPLLLITPDGRIELHRNPGEEAIAFSLKGGTLVRIVDATEVEGTQWYLISLIEGEGRGWIPSEMLTIRLVPTLSFSNFQFCLGDLVGPIGPCGTTLPFGEGIIWLRWDYRGLEPGDIIQHVLVVNGERYQRPPRIWAGPASGQQLANLFDHDPRVEPGWWAMRFIVNGELVTEATVHVR